MQVFHHFYHVQILFDRSGCFHDPTIIQLLFEISRALHDSLDFSSIKGDDHQQSARLICRFVQMVNTHSILHNNVMVSKFME